MPRKQRRPKASDDLLFAAAERACRDLRLFLAGELELSDAQVQAKRGLIREASVKSFYFFAKVVLGNKLLTNQTHKTWCKELQEKWLGISRLMRLKPRGTYKTTIYGISFLLWVWFIYGTDIRFLYTSANQTLLDEVGAVFKRQLEEGSFYSLISDIKRDPEEKNTADTFNLLGKAESDKGTNLMLRTAGGSTNGVHPHIIIIDDPMDINDRTSEATRKSKQIWLDSLTPLLVPYDLKLSNGVTVRIEKIMFIATRWHMKDLVNYAQEKARDNPHAPQWDAEVEGVFLEDKVTPRYPELMSIEQIRALEGGIDSVSFSSWYLNDPLSDGAKIFFAEKMHYFPFEAFDHRKGSNWCFIDPSKGKKGSDYPAVIWVNLHDGTKRIFDAIDQKVPLDAVLKMMAEYNRTYATRAVIVETNGAMTIESTISQAHKDANVSIGIYGIHETANKVERIQAMQPLMFRGDWQFRADYATAYPEAMNQVLNFGSWNHDDFPDVIEKAVTWIANNMPGDIKDSTSKQTTFAGATLKRGGRPQW